MVSGDILSAIASQKTLEEVKERLGKIGSSGKDISEILEELLSQPKIIKHIQRGTVTMSTLTKNVTLAGFSNINKMIVLINGVGERDANVDKGSVSPCVTQLTVSSLSLKVCEKSSETYSYQVIEFC